MKDAQNLQNAGAFAIVLECVESNLSKQVTNTIQIPTIGIGSSYYCDGQILVTDDILGLTKSKIRFVKKFINIKSYIKQAVKKFRSEVLRKKYPSKKYWY